MHNANKTIFSTKRRKLRYLLLASVIFVFGCDIAPPEVKFQPDAPPAKEKPPAQVKPHAPKDVPEK
ncbi:hypothetical protein [Alteromonas sp. 14N.309.X.WAT.G.H12]|uniref:hypothetical protein n=1 Tax=Alteromonas sp. 14N.309.X.WAT.G.H12 TaxID=3120824 RepID=UPI002FD13E2B